MQLGIVGTSNKENERRMAIHPDHLCRLSDQIRRSLVFEKGYGEVFGISDAEIGAMAGGVASRSELLEDLGSVVLPKPVLKDMMALKEGGLLWGWPHCTQNDEFTQIAIARRHSLIAFEDMFVWGPDGHQGRHTFYKNNELAGYCGVLHALQLRGIDGHYGKKRKTVVISFGAVSRGAIYALKARGFRDITICIQRPDHEVREEVLDCHYVRIRRGVGSEPRLLVVEHDGSESPLLELLAEADILVNGIFQDTDQPMMFVTEEEASVFKKDCLIVDVSCDEGMGFYFAKPTTFDEPMLRFGAVDYYAVDHTPSYLWECASRSLSAALVVHLPAVLAGREGWQQSETIRRALVIDSGVIQMPGILTFQKRRKDYPHEVIAAPQT